MLIHAVLEGFAAIDEDHRHFIGVLAAEVLVRVYVNFLPLEAGVTLQFRQTFLDDFTQMASFA